MAIQNMQADLILLSPSCRAEAWNLNAYEYLVEQYPDNRLSWFTVLRYGNGYIPKCRLVV